MSNLISQNSFPSNHFVEAERRGLLIFLVVMISPGLQKQKGGRRGGKTRATAALLWMRLKFRGRGYFLASCLFWFGNKSAVAFYAEIALYLFRAYTV